MPPSVRVLSSRVVSRRAGPGSSGGRTRAAPHPFGGVALVPGTEAVRLVSHYSAGMAARTTWRSLALDVGPVVALTVLALLVDDGERGRSPVPTLVLVVLPLLGRRALPLAVLLLVSAGTLLTAGGAPSPIVQVLSVALASATLGDAAGASTAERTRNAVIVVAVAAFLAIG